MILITSAAYIDYSLAAEFGKLPPCMLPVQNKRLYEHQVNLLRSAFCDEPIYITLPDDFYYRDFDAAYFMQNNITIIKVNPNISLSESLQKALNMANRYDDNLRILHGDTLFKSLPFSNSCYISSEPEIDYKWDYDDYHEVFCGYFSFPKVSDFLKLLSSGLSLTCIASDYCEEQFPADMWLDFSMTNSYYRSVSYFTTQRSFNNLSINNYSVTKSSTDYIKINGEYRWLNEIPEKLKHYVPAVYGYNYPAHIASYKIEYLYNSSLANLYVYGENSLNTWKHIIDSCLEFINREKNYFNTDKSVAKINDLLFTYKTKERLDLFSRETGISLITHWVLNGKSMPSIEYIVDKLDTLIEKNAEQYVSLMHGDFCFSNILYDFRLRDIKVIDPRGIDANRNITHAGDYRYDIAKLAHSVIGYYDYIIADKYNLLVIDNEINFNIDVDKEDIKNYFLSKIDPKLVYPIMINLFFSMLPLHNDNKERQLALLANAFRLYREYVVLYQENNNK